MYQPPDFIISQLYMGGDAGFIFQPRIGSHFRATLFTRPFFRRIDQFFAEALTATMLLHIPGLDVTHRRGFASLGVVAQTGLKKGNWSCLGPGREENRKIWI